MTNELTPKKKIKVKTPLLKRGQLADILDVSKQVIARNTEKKLLKRVFIGGTEYFPAHLNGLEDYIEIIPIIT